MAGSGDVLRMVNHVRPFTPAPDAAITADQAADLARGEAEMPDGSVEDAALRIVFDDNGRQLLVWEVVLTRPVSDGVVEAAFVDVNAITSDASVVGRG